MEIAEKEHKDTQVIEIRPGKLLTAFSKEVEPINGKNGFELDITSSLHFPVKGGCIEVKNGATTIIGYGAPVIFHGPVKEKGINTAVRDEPPLKPNEKGKDLTNSPQTTSNSNVREKPEKAQTQRTYGQSAENNNMPLSEWVAKSKEALTTHDRIIKIGPNKLLTAFSPEIKELNGKNGFDLEMHCSIQFPEKGGYIEVKNGETTIIGYDAPVIFHGPVQGKANPAKVQDEQHVEQKAEKNSKDAPAHEM